MHAARFRSSLSAEVSGHFVAFVDWGAKAAMVWLQRSVKSPQKSPQDVRT